MADTQEAKNKAQIYWWVNRFFSTPQLVLCCLNLLLSGSQHRSWKTIHITYKTEGRGYKKEEPFLYVLNCPHVIDVTSVFYCYWVRIIFVTLCSGVLYLSPDSTTRQRDTWSSKEPVCLSRGKRFYLGYKGLNGALNSYFFADEAAPFFPPSPAYRFMCLNWSLHSHWRWVYSLEVECFGYVILFMHVHVC